MARTNSLSVSLNSYWDLYGNQGLRAVRNCRLRQSAFRGPVKWHVRLRNRTSSLQQATGPPIFVYTASVTCTGPGAAKHSTAGDEYAVCVRVLSELACACSESHT